MAGLRSSKTAPLHSCPPPIGLFKYIFSPQFLFEILFYFFMIPITGYHFTFPFLFTATNQTISALYTLQFYKEKFPEEIAGRKAIIPFIL